MPATFPGFLPPTTNFTRVPDVVFDRLLADLGGSEFKLLCYIIRHTWGYDKTTDAIALSQFQKGITTKEGRQVDKGVGIAEKTILRCLKSLKAKGVIIIFKGQHGHGGSKVNLYSLKMASQSDQQAKSNRGTGKMRVPSQGSGSR